MIEKTGIQTFTIRNDIKSIADMRNSFEFYAKQGIRRFELARINFNQQELELLAALKEDLGLVYTSIQITIDKIEKQFDFLIRFCHRLDIKYIEVSVIPTISFLKKKKGLMALGERLNALGTRTKEHGIRLLYHHHNYELIKYDGVLSLDLLMANTKNDNVNLVIDTYWLARSGYDPAGFIEKRISRICGLHLRDCAMHWRLGRFYYSDTQIGTGTIDFQRILSLDKYENIHFYSIEQDTSNPKGDIILGLQYLKNLIKNNA